MTAQSGGGSSSSHGKQLAYAQITAEFDVADATNVTVIPGLAFTFSPGAGVLYCLEFYSPAVEENSGTTLGDVMLVRLLLDGVDVAYGFGVNGLGGIGTCIPIRSSTLTGDGLPHALTANVQNRTTGANGAIVYALLNSPAYVRAVEL